MRVSTHSPAAPPSHTARPRSRTGHRPPGASAAGITSHGRQPRTHRVSQVTLSAVFQVSEFRGRGQAVASVAAMPVQRPRSQTPAAWSRHAVHELMSDGRVPSMRCGSFRKVLRVHGPPPKTRGQKYRLADNHARRQFSQACLFPRGTRSGEVAMPVHRNGRGPRQARWPRRAQAGRPTTGSVQVRGCGSVRPEREIPAVMQSR